MAKCACVELDGDDFLVGDPRVLILAYYFPPENTSGAARPGRFFNYLPKFGLQPAAICGLPDLAAESAPGVYRVPEATARQGAKISSQLASFVQRFALPYNEELPWAPHAVWKAQELIRQGGVSAIVSTSPPICTHVAAMWLKARTGVWWVADFRDPFDGNPFRNRKWLFNYDFALERKILEMADAVIVNTDGVETWWRKKYPEFAQKIKTIWNGFDPERIVSVKLLAGNETPKLVHLGTIYGGRHPGLLADSLLRLKVNLHLELIGIYDISGDPSRGASLEKLVQEGRASYNGKMVPAEEADRRMAEADYLLLLDLNEQEASVQVPAKIFDYLRVERPILTFTTKGSPTESILRQSGGDHMIVYRNDPPETIDAKVTEFLKPGPRVTKPNDWFWTNFDGVSQTGQLADVIKGR